MTDRERTVLNRQIGVLEGLTWVSSILSESTSLAERIEVVVTNLQKLLDDDRERRLKLVGGASDENA